MKEDELQKAKVFIICEVIDYTPNTMTKNDYKEGNRARQYFVFDTGEAWLRGNAFNRYKKRI